MLNIALFGPPGCGKGTQSKILIEKFGLTYISTGDLLRKEIAAQSNLGLAAKKIIDKGGLVDDDLIVKLIEKHVENNHEHGILFDGFPRTHVQCYILDGILADMGHSLTAMLSLEAPEDILMTRMLERAKISGRSDDNETVIKMRFKEYQEKTLPVVEFYQRQKKVHIINGVGTIEEISQRIDNVINSLLIARN